MQKSAERSFRKKGWRNKPTKLQFLSILPRTILMLSKRYESTEVDRRTWLQVPSGLLGPPAVTLTQVVKIYIETSTKMYTPFRKLMLFCLI